MSDEHDLDELDMIRAAVAGDEQAFDGVVKHYAARLRWLIRLRLDPAVRARVSADDILQEAMLVVSDRIKALVIDSEGAFWTWLCRVVEQRLIDVRRRHAQAAVRTVHREQRLEPAGRSTAIPLDAFLLDAGTSPSGRLRSAEQRESLGAALEQLPGSFREVIILRILEGLSVSDTAAIMGRSPGAVSVLLTKAVKRLAKVIGPAAPNMMETKSFGAPRPPGRA